MEPEYNGSVTITLGNGAELVVDGRNRIFVAHPKDKCYIYLGEKKHNMAALIDAAERLMVHVQ